jgi:hypothetical protein
VAKDCVVTVISGWYERPTLFVFRQQTKPVPVIPASGPLAQVAAYRPHIADLWAGHAGGGMREGVKIIVDRLVVM